MDCRHVSFLLLSQFDRINRLLTPPFQKSSGNPRVAQGQRDQRKTNEWTKAAVC